MIFFTPAIIINNRGHLICHVKNDLYNIILQQALQLKKTLQALVTLSSEGTNILKNRKAQMPKSLLKKIPVTVGKKPI